MKANRARKVMAVLAATSLACAAATVRAQGAAAANSAPQLAYGVAQILQLAQARVSDDTIIAYIRNSGNSYGLNADQIIYLRQQGLSDTVLTAMLNQPRAGRAVTLPTTPAPAPVASTAYAGEASTDTAAPSVAYAQTVPDAYYSEPYYYYNPYYYCYPGYGWYPPLGIGWGWGWHGGRYYGGGYRGGWHGGGFGGFSHGGGFAARGHGGGFSSGHGGGFGGGGHGGGHR